MKDINLLPKAEKQKKKGFLLFNFLVATLIILLIATAGFSYFLVENRKELEKKLDVVKKTNFDLNIHKEKLLFYKNFERQVDYKSRLTKALDVKTIKWSHKLYELSDKLPEKTYIINYNGRCDNLYSFILAVKNGTDIPAGRLLAFSIEGYSNDYIEISKLILEIKSITDISKPWIVTVRESEIENLKLLYFKIEAFWNVDNFIDYTQNEKEEYPENIRNIKIEDMQNL